MTKAVTGDYLTNFLNAPRPPRPHHLQTVSPAVLISLDHRAYLKYRIAHPAASSACQEEGSGGRGVFPRRVAGLSGARRDGKPARQWEGGRARAAARKSSFTPSGKASFSGSLADSRCSSPRPPVPRSNPGWISRTPARSKPVKWSNATSSTLTRKPCGRGSETPFSTRNQKHETRYVPTPPQLETSNSEPETRR